LMVGEPNSSASVLGAVKTALGSGQELPAILAHGPAWHTLALGAQAGSLGETSALLITAGGLFLLATRIISWHIPAAMLGTLLLLAGTFHLLDPVNYPGPVHHLLDGLRDHADERLHPAHRSFPETARVRPGPQGQPARSGGRPGLSS